MAKNVGGSEHILQRNDGISEKTQEYLAAETYPRGIPSQHNY
jgi:hypothetical protein